MVETTGLLLLSAAGVTDSIIGFGAASSLSFAGISVSISTAATITGALALGGAAIGLQYALSNPNVPKPENGAQSLKQSIPVRQRGYWINRLGGYYMLSIAAGGDSQDVLAFHSGRIELAFNLYLHDWNVAVNHSLLDGEVNTVIPPLGIYFQNVIAQIFYGGSAQNCGLGIINSATTSGEWTSDYAGKGSACLSLICAKATDAEQFTKIYPQQLPLPSVVAKCAPVYDPRDVAQDRSDPFTWRASPNPVLQLMDYLTEPDGGMGEDFDVLFPAAKLALWMAEADLCDELLLSGRARYESAGFYQFDNSPENVINKILSTMDGWLCEDGDGSLTLTSGVYREPTDPPLTAEYILGWTWQKGQADEDTVNQLDVTFTDPSKGYVTNQIAPVRDEDGIALTGSVRSKPLDLSWVQSEDQADVLAQRALLRINPEISGSFVTTLYGLRYLGKRWIKLQFPTIAGLEDCVVEIQDRGDVDLLSGRVTINWSLVDPVALAALN